MSKEMFCDPKTGVCEIPTTQSEVYVPEITALQKPVKIVYFTDPICSACWAIEPQLRKLAMEYHNYYDIEYYMGGLLPGWEGFSGNGLTKPADVAEHWEEVADHFQMPISGDVWLTDPLDSSYPPSIAFKAAQMQSEEKALKFMRRLREMVFVERKNICRLENMMEAAENCGLDKELFKRDFLTDAPKQFENDLQTARQWRIRGFPSLYFTDDKGNNELIYGVRPHEMYEATLLKLAPEAVKIKYNSDWESLFSKFPTLAPKEFALLTNQSYENAQAALEALFNEHKLRKISTKNGNLYQI